MIRIVSDSGSDITYVEAEKMGIEIVELDVTFDEFPYDLHNDLDFGVFYENLTKAKNLPRTSQVNPSQYLELFNEAKEKGEEILVVTLSGGLSGTHSSAMIALEECGYDGITVVDSRHATITQRMLVDTAIRLRNEGKSRSEIEKTLVGLQNRIGFACLVDTMTYLKKGGRIPPAMALIGQALKIKPVIGIQDGKASPIDRVRGLQAGMNSIWTAFEKDGYIEDSVVYFGYTGNRERGLSFMEETKAKYGIKNCVLYPVGSVIGTHIGPNAIAMGYYKKGE